MVRAIDIDGRSARSSGRGISLAPAPIPKPPGIITQFKIQEGSGEIIEDSVGDLEGTLTEVTWESGDFVGGYTISGDGTESSYVTIPDFPWHPENGFTIAFTFRTSDTGKIIAADNNDFIGFTEEWDPDNQANSLSLSGTTSNGVSGVQTNDSYNDGQLHRAVITGSSLALADIEIWVDGNEDEYINRDEGDFVPASSKEVYLFQALGGDVPGPINTDPDNLIVADQKWTPSDIENDLHRQPWYRPPKSLSPPDEEGLWHFMNDPKPFQADGKTFMGWTTLNQEIGVWSLDHSTGETNLNVWDHGVDSNNDHLNPTFIELGDGRIMACYDRSSDVIYRITENPYDITSFGPEQTISGSHDYSNGVRIPAENDRLFLMTRNNQMASYMTSSDGGDSWSGAQDLFSSGEWQYPYVRRGDESTVHILITGNPKFSSTDDVRYLRYENGSFYKADGSHIVDEGGFPVSNGAVDIVYNAGSVGHDSRAYDLRVGPNGTPYILYTRYEDSDSGETHHEHFYVYAYWDGSAWQNKDITSSLPASEGDSDNGWLFSGGASIDPTDMSSVYLSEMVDGQFEIRKATTSDGGDTWSFEDITSGSSMKNIRPITVTNPNDELRLFWGYGSFQTYGNWDTRVTSDYEA